MQRLLIHIIFFFGCLTGLQGQSNFIITPDTTIFQIGEKRNLKLIAPELIINKKLDYSRWDTILPQEFTGTFDKENPSIEFLSESEWLKNANGSLEKNIEFIMWKEGIYFLPPLEVQSRDRRSILSNTVSFKVQSPLTGGLEADPENLAPIKSIIREPINILDYIIPILIVLAILAFFGLLLFLNSRHNKKQISTQLIEYESYTAAEIALKKIEVLEAEALWTKDQSKQHQSSFAYILREFLSRNFKFPALELSSSEIMQSFKSLKDDTNQQNLLYRLLNISDLVKFAKAIPGEEMHKQFLTEIRSFIGAEDLKEKFVSLEKGDDYAYKKLLYQGLEFDYQLPDKIVHADYKSQLASPFERLLSLFVDRICFTLLCIVFFFIYASIFMVNMDFMTILIELYITSTQIILGVIFLILSFLYFPVAHWFFDASFGKWIFRQKFYFKKQNKSFVKYLIRWIVTPFSWILGIGYIMAFFTEDVQTLHDLAAGTTVINTEDNNLEI